MAFYAIFSLFPFLLLLVLGGRLVIGWLGLADSVLDLTLSVFPQTFSETVSRNVVDALEARGALAGAAGVVGLLGLAWAATSGFAILAQNLSRAWRAERPLGLIGARLRALAVVGSLIALLSALLVSRAALRLLPAWTALLRRRVDLGLPDGAASGVLAFLLFFLILLLLYRLAPAARVRWLHAAAGALVASAAMLGATSAFTAYLRWGLSGYRLVYGSLGALISFMTWVYLLAIIVLFGAYLGAAIADRGRARGGAEK